MALVTDRVYRLALSLIVAELDRLYREKRRVVTEHNRYIPPASPV